MASFDITQASINGEPCVIVCKNQFKHLHEVRNDVISLGDIALGIKLPPSVKAGEHDLVLRLQIG